MSDSQIEEIKSKLNVFDIVGSYVKLTKTGINYRGLCPFHSEKGPSFFVSPGRQMWKCFGCGKGGDIFEFIEEIEGVEFGDALRLLAAKAGVELKRENPQVVSERKRLYEICDLACSFFEKQLGNSAYGKDAKEYLLKRGITEESIAKWRLGYSPDTWQGLSDFLVGRGYDRDEIVRAGLAVQSDKGNDPYDRFRGRIIFPLFDSNSQVIGFTARIFKDADKKEMAKYINTPQTMLYDKSNVLYGINYAKGAIRKENQCVLTEGQTDTIMCHQAGFENTVAVSGTALTPRHLMTLKRYTDNLLLSFDMDVAGDNATKRGINLAESQGFNIKVIDTYSGAKDPAEIILENPENWRESVKNARTIMDFYFDSAFAKIDKTDPKGKKEIGKIVLPAIKRIQNKIEQSHWVQKLSEKLGVTQEAVLEEMKSIKVEGVAGQEAFSNQTTKTEVNKFTSEGRKKLLEDRIISLIFKKPTSISLIKEIDYPLFCESNKEFIEELSKVSGPEDKLKGLFADISQKEEHKNTFGMLYLMTEADVEEIDPEELNLCLFQLKQLELKNELGRLSGAMKKDLTQQTEEHIKEFEAKAKKFHQKT